MTPTKASEQANAFYRAYGAAANVKIAAKVRECEEAGRHEEAADWRLVQNTISMLHGPRQT